MSGPRAPECLIPSVADGVISRQVATRPGLVYTFMMQLKSVLVLFVTLGAAAAHADQDAQHVSTAKRVLDQFTARADVFDGTAIVAGAKPMDIKNQMRGCAYAAKTARDSLAQVSAKGKSSAEAQAIAGRVDVLRPWCDKLNAVGPAYLAQLEGKASADQAQATANKSMCNAVLKDAHDAGIDLYQTLDTWQGTRTLGSAEAMRSFRANLEKLAPVCAKPERANAATACLGGPPLLSSETNTRYEIADICRAAGDPKRTLTEAANRLVAMLSRGSASHPTVDSFRAQQGWVRDEMPVSYATMFSVSDADKDRLKTHVKDAYAAAGLDTPTDLSGLWAERQAYLDALKAAVDATRAEWKLAQGPCNGYTCDLAKTSIVGKHKQAVVKRVLAEDWKVSMSELGLPLERYMTMFVVFGVPGEPGCQARQVTAYEPYKGAGKYAKASGTKWGYVRFEACP